MKNNLRIRRKIIRIESYQEGKSIQREKYKIDQKMREKLLITGLLLVQYLVLLSGCIQKKAESFTDMILKEQYMLFENDLNNSPVNDADKKFYSETINRIESSNSKADLEAVVNSNKHYFSDEATKSFLNEDIPIEEKKDLLKYTFFLAFERTYVKVYPAYNMTNWNAIPLFTKEGTTTYQIHSKNYFSVKSFPLIVTNLGDTISLKDVEGTPYFEFEAPESVDGFQIHVAYPFGINIYPLIIGIPIPYEKREL